MKTPASIVYLDIETAPNLGYVWGKWEQNVIENKSDWYIISIAWKWAHEDKVNTLALNDFNGHTAGSEDDSALVHKLWDIFDKADIIVAHNGDGFDIPKIKTRFIIQGFAPPSPFKTVDTLKIARNQFKFDSNKLDDLGAYLKIGRKLPHTGFHLWRSCIVDNNVEAWDKMKQYNGHDVELLEKVYFLMRAWLPTHPNVNKGETACPKCGSPNIQCRGFDYTLLMKKQRYQCTNCRGWFSGSSKKI